MLVAMTKGIVVGNQTSRVRVPQPRIRGIVVGDEPLIRDVAHTPELYFLVDRVPMSARRELQYRVATARINQSEIEIARCEVGPLPRLQRSRQPGKR